MREAPAGLPSSTLEAGLRIGHRVRAVLHRVNQLAREVLGVAVADQEVTASLMKERLAELVTVIPGVAIDAPSRSVRPLPRLIPLHAIAGFPHDLGAGRLRHRRLGEPTA